MLILNDVIKIRTISLGRIVFTTPPPLRSNSSTDIHIGHCHR
jgi:hypothetical protein